jgi:hypothetical protein
MGSVTTTSVISRASVLLNDTENIHWAQLELLDWLNDGQRELVLHRPSACVKNTDMLLKQGTKQALPADGNSLVDIPRNTNGYSIRPTSRQLLDAISPDWHLPTKAKAKVEHFCYAATDPKTFYVFPPSPGGNSVEVIYNANPAQVGIGNPISVDDIYASALVDYILFRALAKDTDYAPTGPSSGAHYQAFLAAIGVSKPVAA